MQRVSSAVVVILQGGVKNLPGEGYCGGDGENIFVEWQWRHQ